MKASRLAALLLVPLPLLTACGGGTSDSTALNSGTAVSILITDAFSDQYSKVWVTVSKITADDANGQTVTLFDNAAGTVVNLAELNGVATLLNTQNLANGSYGNFQVTLADTVNLVDKMTGQTINATITGTGQDQTIPVQGQITVGSTMAITIDFDLQQFSYDPTTNIVTPVLILRQTPAQQPMRTIADVDGTITTITDATTFTMLDRYGIESITVTLEANATVVNAKDGSVTADTSALQTAQEVTVTGNYDPSQMTIAATNVSIHDTTMTNPTNPATPGMATMSNAKLEGIVNSYDSNTGILSLDIRESTFMPAGSSIDIDILGNNPVFSKGSIDILAAGQRIEIRGDWQDPDLIPTMIEIEGGLPHYSMGRDDDGHEDDDNDDHHRYQDSYVEVKGTVAGIQDQQLDLDVLKAEHSNVMLQAGDSLSIDLSNAFFKYGDSSCLEDNDLVEIKGAIDDTGAMTAQVIEIENKVCAMPTMGTGSTTGSGTTTGSNTGTGSTAGSGMTTGGSTGTGSTAGSGSTTGGSTGTGSTTGSGMTTGGSTGTGSTTGSGSTTGGNTGTGSTAGSGSTTGGSTGTGSTAGSGSTTGGSTGTGSTTGSGMTTGGSTGTGSTAGSGSTTGGNTGTGMP